MGISIIVCSRNPELLSALSKNISQSIGCEYELLFKNNNSLNSSIASVYNSLTQQAKFENIIFLHEDIEFLSSNWGSIIQQILSVPSIGLVGLSGSIYKSKFPGVWSAASKQTYRISGSKFLTDLNTNYLYSKVTVIDGCFMATKKKIMINCQFDEKLKGFHCYDVDISLQMKDKYEVVVANEIKFHHFSEGFQNLDWLHSSFYIHKKWQMKLPAITDALEYSNCKLEDYLAAQNVYNVIHRLRFSKYLILKFYFLFIFKYYRLNKFRYTKKTFQYFVQ